MKPCLFIFALTCTINCFSQSDSTKYLNRLKVGYGNFYPLKSNFGSSLKHLNNQYDYPLHCIYITVEHQKFSDLGFTYFINQIKYNPDHAKTNWFATNFHHILKYNLTSKNKYMSLFVGGGALFGAQFITVRKDETETFRNFNASLVPHLELRIRATKRLGVGLVSNFLFDLTKPTWKSFEKTRYSVSDNKFSGTMVNLYIGWSYMKL